VRFVEADRLDQLDAVGKAAVEGADADTGRPRDLLHRHIRANTDKEPSGGFDDLLPVAPRVGA